MARIKTGSCNCGAITFQIDGQLRPVTYCHCRQCRKQSGHFFAATACDHKNIVISGEGNLTWFNASSEAKRGFCKICGSTLFWQKNDASYLSILAGSLDNPTQLKAKDHIFVADKGDYYSINDGLPQFAQYD